MRNLLNSIPQFLCVSAVTIAIVFTLSPLLHAQTPDNILLVVNEKSDDSKSIARYYAEKRKIPAANICRIQTGTDDKISRAAFESEILRPVADYLKSKNLQDRILYIVTTRGLPLIVEGDESATGDMAAVDSELTLLYRYMLTGLFPAQGRMENPYFAVDFNPANFRPFTRAGYDVYLVTRLTGASGVDAILLVERALAAPAPGDFYFDLASGRRTTILEWSEQAAAKLKDAGAKATVESTGTVLEDLKNVQGYANEGASDQRIGNRIPQLQWSPGAIATVFDRITALGAEQTATHYVESGVTGFAGYVADPTPDGYLRPQILFPSYAAGYNLAEAFYASMRYLSWRSVVIGDPLAAPYAAKMQKLRADQAAAFDAAAMSAETGLPDIYSKRRQAWLTRKYSTGDAPVTSLLKAEEAAARGDNAVALALVNRSLEQDPYVAESSYLKAVLLERTKDSAGALEFYGKARKLGLATSELKAALARLNAAAEPAPREDSNKDVLPPDPGASVTVLSPTTPPPPVADGGNYPARIVSRIPIEYPTDARDAGIQGPVTIRVLLDEMGQVMKAQLVSGDPKLGKAAIAAIKRWRFEPRLENGRPVVAYFTIPLNFEIKKK